MGQTTSLAHKGLYGFADVGRYGLGHSLLAWARCRLWCDDHSIPMLAPSWRQLRIGPILRGERDKRQYYRLFRFPGYYVRGIRRLALLAGAERVAAESADLAELPRERTKGLVVFRNLLAQNEETHFREILGRGLQVRDRLVEMTRPQYVPAPPATPSIALHVRMGDFTEVASAEKLRAGAKNARIPVEWYRAMLLGLRARLGSNYPAIVFSDGTDESLARLIELPGVRRSPRQQSIADLLSISQSRLLVSSGSGFSMWGAFLGDIPRICHPGQRLVRVLTASDGVDREPECDSADEIAAPLLARLTDAPR